MDPVRRVVIETEIRHAKSSAGAGSVSPTGTIGGADEARVVSRQQANSINRVRHLVRSEERLYREKLKNLDLERKLQEIRKRGARQSNSGANRGGQGANYFSTGIPALDKFNQIGFQGFITLMSARMVGMLAKSGAEGLAGLSGEGAGLIAQGVRAFSGDARSRRDPIRNWLRDTGGDILRGLGGREDAKRLGLGVRGQRWITEGSGLQAEFSQIAQGRMTPAMQEEDRLLKEKRELLREELSLIQKRMEADNELIKRALGQRVAAERAFGILTPTEREEYLRIGGQLQQGQDVSTFSAEDRRRINSSTGRTLFPGFADTAAENISRQYPRFMQNILGLSNFNLQGGSLLGQEAGAFRDANRIRAEASPIRAELNTALNATLNIERLELETKEFVDTIQAALVPEFEKLFEQLKAEVLGLMGRIEQEKKAGGNPAVIVDPKRKHGDKHFKGIFNL